MTDTIEKRRHFIRQIIEDDLAAGKHKEIVTRFPPEPNGYLHFGHARSICLNFGIAGEYPGRCNLRFDDTNPLSEELEFVEAIKADIKWLGFDWDERLFYASGYYDKLYDFAVTLIKQGKAFVDGSSAEQMRSDRGTLTEAGKNSPDRDRSIEDNLDLFERMKAGEFEDGTYVLRAKIDMASGNLNMRDPALYRVRHAHHQMTGDKWCIYPMYDFAHSLSDALEGITHSLCTLEFEDHRPLYEWFTEHCNPPAKPRQIEFSRLNISHTITSKRKLKTLVEDQHVSGWDDPRMPTLIGMRRRGYPPAAIREFCEITGISKSNSTIDMGVFEECVRDDLNNNAPRAMCVLDPLKVVIENYPEDKVEMLTASAHPNREDLGVRELPFSRELYIERDDFMLQPESKFFRLAPGKEVRLRSSYVIKCNNVITDKATGDIIELRCTYDADTLGKKPEGRKVKGVIHWVSAKHCATADVRLYDRLFTVENPGSEEDFTQFLNPHSLDVVQNCYIEPGLANAKAEQQYQFERLGYFVLNQKHSTDDKPVFNRVVSLRDSWNN